MHAFFNSVLINIRRRSSKSLTKHLRFCSIVCCSAASTARSLSLIESSGCRAMGIRVPAVVRVKQMLRQSSCSAKRHHSSSLATKKGHFAVYVDGAEREMKRFAVPIAYLQHPLFQSLLRRAEEEYGFDNSGSVLRVPCDEVTFARLTSQINY